MQTLPSVPGKYYKRLGKRFLNFSKGKIRENLGRTTFSKKKKRKNKRSLLSKSSKEHPELGQSKCMICSCVFMYTYIYIGRRYPRKLVDSSISWSFRSFFLPSSTYRKAWKGLEDRRKFPSSNRSAFRPSETLPTDHFHRNKQRNLYATGNEPSNVSQLIVWQYTVVQAM